MKNVGIKTRAYYVRRVSIGEVTSHHREVLITKSVTELIMSPGLSCKPALSRAKSNNAVLWATRAKPETIQGTSEANFDFHQTQNSANKKQPPVRNQDAHSPSVELNGKLRLPVTPRQKKLQVTIPTKTNLRTPQ